MRLKYKLNLIIILFLLLILTVPAYASVNIENQYTLNAESITPFVYYNNATFPYYNSYCTSGLLTNYLMNSSYVYDNLSNNKTFSETNITSVLCYNTLLGIGETNGNQTITDYITNLTATKYSTAVYIYVYNFVGNTNFNDLYIYENNKTEYDFNSYNNINENYNISSIVSPEKNVTFSLGFDPKNQASPTTEYGSIYYMLYFNNNNAVYYKYYGVINMDITTEEDVLSLLL